MFYIPPTIQCMTATNQSFSDCNKQWSSISHPQYSVWRPQTNVSPTPTNNKVLYATHNTGYDGHKPTLRRLQQTMKFYISPTIQCMTATNQRYANCNKQWNSISHPQYIVWRPQTNVSPTPTNNEVLYPTGHKPTFRRLQQTIKFYIPPTIQCMTATNQRYADCNKQYSWYSPLRWNKIFRNPAPAALLPTGW
jgi:hypothetical protein